MQLSQETIDAFKADVLARYPEEACGVIINGEYFSCPNASTEPKTKFKIDGRKLKALTKKGEIQAILHSHTYHINEYQGFPPEWPSYTDTDSWIKGGIPWGIVCTEGEGVSDILWLDDNDIEPLEGRKWIHVKSDCFTLSRDYFRTKYNLPIKNYPREMNWFANGKDYFNEFFEQEGFVEVKSWEVREGDVALIKIRSKVPNHCCVVVGTNKILNHMYNRPSRIEDFGHLQQHVVKYLRHKDLF